MSEKTTKLHQMTDGTGVSTFGRLLDLWYLLLPLCISVLFRNAMRCLFLYRLCPARISRLRCLLLTGSSQYGGGQFAPRAEHIQEP
jgi:hypothetical protein